MRFQEFKVAIAIFAMTLALLGCTQDTQVEAESDGTVSTEGVVEKLREAKVAKTTHEYTHGEATLEGFFCVDEALEADEKRPGVLIVHAWMGIDDHVNEVANRLAKAGFVAFACDIYGKGIRPTNAQEAGAQAGIYRGDRALQRARVAAGLAELAKHKNCDTSKIVAIGYCFGGGTVLELARSGADLAGVVSFHGNLDTPNPDDAKNIKCKVLVQHGGDDPHVNDEAVQGFINEMRAAKVDWTFTAHGGAVHSFTHKNADQPTAKYFERADKRSWVAMSDFFEEVLGRSAKGF